MSTSFMAHGTAGATCQGQRVQQERGKSILRL